MKKSKQYLWSSIILVGTLNLVILSSDGSDKTMVETVLIFFAAVSFVMYLLYERKEKKKP